MPDIGQQLRHAVKALCSEIEEHKNTQFSAFSSEFELWNELMSCILGSQVPYEVAKAASERIRATRLFSCCDALSPLMLERSLMMLLLEPLEVGGIRRRYRFPVMRSRQLTAAFVAVRQPGQSISEQVFSGEDAKEIRAALVSRIPGLGPKQASMFLRNIGQSQNLAVLDSHVLRFMHAVGLLRERPSPPTTLKTYEVFERVLGVFCQELGYAVGHVDRAIWIVMRVARREALV